MWSGAAKSGFQLFVKATCKEKHTLWEGQFNFETQALGGQLAKASEEHQIHHKNNGMCTTAFKNRC